MSEKEEKPKTDEKKPVLEEKKPAEEKAKPEQKPTPTTQAPAEEKKEGTQKKKKINRMTAKELERNIDQVKRKMGGLNSAYARQLLKRKEQLLADSVESREQKSELEDNAKARSD